MNEGDFMERANRVADRCKYTGIFALLAVILASTAAAQDFPGNYIQIPGPLGFGGIPPVPTNLTPNAGSDYVFLARQSNGTMSGVNYLPLSSFASSTDLATLNNRISQGFQQLDDKITQTNRGVAAAVAISSAPMPSAPGRTSWTLNASTFAGVAGTGFSIAHRLNLNVPLAISASYGNGGGTAHVGRVGLMGEF
jgi:hypothetical protein